MSASYIAEMARDAISTHDADGCCTEASPCALRAKLTDFHGISMRAFGHHELPTRQGGTGGNQTVAGSRDSYSIYATDAQVSFLKVLVAERDIVGLREHDLAIKFMDGGQLRKSEASRLISELKTTAYNSTVSSNGFQKDRAAKAKAPAERPVIEPGLYRNGDGVIVKAYKARMHDGILAARLDVTADKPWQYLGAAYRFVTDQFERMTLEQAKDFGRTAIDGRFYCCQCGIELTDPNSQEQGIGPICSGKV